MIDSEARSGERSLTTPVDDIFGRFQSDQDEYFDCIKSYASGVSLARRIKDKHDLGVDFLTRLGCGSGKRVLYATHMYTVLCFSDIKGDFAAWPN